MGRAALASGLTEVVAVWEPDKNRRSTLQELFPAATFSAHYQTLLKSCQPDLACIASPDYLHCEHALAALAAGCDVLLNSPLATTAHDALKIVAAAETSHAVAMVHEPDPEEDHHWERTWQRFINAVDGLRAVPSPLSQAAEQVATSEAASCSQVSGRPQAPVAVPPSGPWGRLEPAQLRMRHSQRPDQLPRWSPPPDYDLRPYQPEDDPALRELLTIAGFSNKATDDGYSTLINQEEAVPGTRVVEHNGQIVAATFGGRWNEQVGKLDYVSGSPDHRGRSLGFGVCVAVMRYLYEAGYKTVQLNTDDWRLPAIRTYLKIGFEPCHYREDMKGRWERVMGRLSRYQR